ncbi:MAG: autotransporter domain-containing protein [Alphaproteobacteria bacterium]|nr:autotransporter domain-containing protein [Alphaproteobacteria bacterium SS10]
MKRDLLRGTALASALVVGLGFGAAAKAQSTTVNGAIDTMVFVGDSLSDPGNQPALLGGANQPPSPPYSENRFSNGDVFSQVVPGTFGVDDSAVVNTAVGGAFTGQIEVAPGITAGNIVGDPTNPLSSRDILAQAQEVAASGVLTQGNSVATVWGGANNYFLELNSLDPTASSLDIFNSFSASVNEAVTDIAEAAQTLAAGGADTVVLFNLPSFSGLPQFTALGPEVAAAAGQLTAIHNGAIAGLAADLQAAGINAQVVDVDGLFTEVQANPAAFGFSNITDACINDAACVTASVEAQNEFLFFDTVHPTSSAHGFIAQAFEETFTGPLALAATGDAGQAAVLDYGNGLLSRLGLLDLNDDETTVFGDVNYLDVSYDDDGGVLGSDFDLVRADFGIAFGVTDSTLIGVGIAYEQGSSDINNNAGDFDFESLRASAFADYDNGTWGIGAVAAFGSDDYQDINRNTAVTGLSAGADADGRSVYVAAEGRYHVNVDMVSITPAIRLGYANATVDEYNESGATGLNRAVGEQDVDNFFGEIGATVSADFEVGDDGGFFRPHLSLFLHQDFDDSERSVTSSLVSAPGAITTTDIDGRDTTTGHIALGVDFLSGPWTVGILGDYQTSNPDGFGITGRMTYKF